MNDNINNEVNEEVIYDDITPYYASKVASIVLGYEIKPQQFYGYANRNKIESYKAADGKVYFKGSAFKSWLDNSKNGTKSTKVNIEDLASKFI